MVTDAIVRHEVLSPKITKFEEKIGEKFLVLVKKDTSYVACNDRAANNQSDSRMLL